MNTKYSVEQRETLANAWYLRSKGHFFISMAVAVLGGAAILWILASFGWLDLSNRVRMEKRTMEATGATERPRGQLKVVTQSDACLHIDGAFANGKTVHFYARNTCSKQLGLPNYAYNVETADGTTIESGLWAFDGNKRIQAGERREQKFDFDSDSRVVSVVVRAVD